MRLSISFLRLTVAWLLLVGFSLGAKAADSTFVGRLALLIDPDVARELALSDDTKAKIVKLIDSREQEALNIEKTVKGKSAADRAAALAPFVAESEKQGKALLTDEQWGKLDKLRIAKEGMLGLLSPDVAQKLQLTPEQTKDIGDALQQYKSQTTALTSDIQKRAARSIFERKIAGMLNETQRGAWEQLSGAPAGGSVSAQTPAGGGGAPGGNSSNSGPGGVNVQRAGGGAAELTVTEDGMFKINFEFTPWKNVLEYFARKGG